MITTKAMKILQQLQFGILVVLLALLAAFTLNLQADNMDYGSVPALTQPQGDKTVENQKLDFHADLFTGRFNYSIPIEVPPARGGSEPGIALQYSSSGGNGWCGVGWDLDLGYIERETRLGSPLDTYYGWYDDSAGFIYSVAGQAGRLIHATDGTYRPEINTAGLKFVYNGTYWIVTDKSGRTYKFGDTSGARISDSYMGTFKWMLTAMQDADGNQTAIAYQQPTPADGQLYLSQIAYNANNNSPALPTNCTVIFGLESRADMPDSAISGMDIYDSRRLHDILVKCNGAQVRHYVLQYTNSTSTGKSLLLGITEYGTDDKVHWPALAFKYSALSRSFLPAAVWAVSTNTAASYPSGFYPSSPKSMLLDVDGDGLPDWVTISTDTSGGFPIYNNYRVQLNNGHGFDAVQKWTIDNEAHDGTLTGWNWLNSYTVPYGIGGTISTCGLQDINGDGLPDRVMTPNGTGYLQVQLNTGSSFNFLSQWLNVPPVYLSSGSSSATVYSSGITAPGYLVAASIGVCEFVDMNGDGLPDLVTTSSDPTKLSVTLNAGGGFFQTPAANWPNLSSGTRMRNQDTYGSYGDLADMNGDGLPDHVQPGGVQLNLGPYNGFDTALSWGLTNNEAPGIIDYQGAGNSFLHGCFSKQLLDINGDGLPDLVRSNNPAGTYAVRYNTGRGFSTNWVTWSNVNTSVSYGLNSWSKNTADATSVLFMDMNGDGLPDRVIYNPAGTNSLLVQLNAGPYPDLLTVISNGLGGVITATYTNSTVYDNSAGYRSWLSSPVRVVTSVTTSDGIRVGTKMTYSYTGGFFDYTNREFRGFAYVDATDYLGIRTRTYFHQGGGQDWSSHGEYQDTRFKAGMAYDVITYGSDGNQYKNVISQVTQVKIDANGVYFPFVTNVFEIDTEIPGKARSSLKQYSYVVTPNNLAASTGNLLQEVFAGEVTNVSYYFAYSSVSDPSAPVYTTYAYASLSNTNIIDKASSITVSSDAAGNDVLRQTLYQYFGSTGDLQQKSELVCPGTYANTAYTYDNYGNPLTSTDPMGLVTTMSYDTSATFMTAKVIGSLTSGFQYDPGSGSLLAATNEQGIVTANSYDGLWRPTSSAISTTPGGATTLTRSIYAHALGGISGNLSLNCETVSVIDPASPTGYHMTYTYLDGLGRPIQFRDATETNNICRVSDIFYDWNGRFISQSYPFFATGTNHQSFTGNYTNTYTAYDVIGRVQKVYPLVKATLSSGDFSSYTVLTGDGGSPVGPTSIDYNDGNNSWAVVITNALGKVHKYLLDSQGRTNQIVEVTSAGNYTTTLSYDLVGDLTNLTDHAGNKIAMFYDLLGQKVALADPDMGFWQYIHDLDGRLKIQIDARGCQTKCFYSDTAGRLTRREGWNAANQCVSTSTWIYDSSGGDSSCTVYPGQLYQVTDDEGWQKFSYDARNRTLASVRYLSKNNTSYTNRFTFDDADRLTATAYPNNGPTIANTFDAGGHLKSVAQGTTNFYTATSFNELNQLNGVNFGNGAATAFTYYKASKRLNKVLTTAAGSVTIQSFTNRYDAGGNIIGLQDLVSSHTGSASATITSASYDDLNRLTTATWTGYGTKNYGYSPIGNVLTNGESGTSNYVYGTIRPHCVRNANGVSYTYDLNGNVSMRGRQHLFYDVNNRLSLVLGTNGVETTFGYDASGARLWEQPGTNGLQVWMGNVYEEKDGQTLFHVYAGSQLVCTFDRTGTNTYEFYHPDYLGSTSLQTDKNGNQIQHYEYSAFGQTRYTGNTNAPVPSRRYTGQILDDATGLYYYNARYYDPVLGRFVQADDVIPNLFNPQSYNRYSYCINNPLRFTDPSGHEFVLNAGLVPGPVPYMTAESTLGKIGASVYNMLPLVDNTIHQALKPVNAAFDKAGDVVHDTVLLTTGDYQLAENGRALPLLVGGEIGMLGKVEKAEAVVATTETAVNLEQRAKELHGLLNPQAQRMRTTAVTATEEGVTYVSSSENALSKAQKAALKPSEVAAEGPGHAEVTGINAAKDAGHTPTATAASRPICPTCAQTLQEQGVKPASPLKKTD